MIWLASKLTALATDRHTHGNARTSPGIQMWTLLTKNVYIQALTDTITGPPQHVNSWSQVTGVEAAEPWAELPVKPYGPSKRPKMSEMRF